ncbi:MAG: hypothetical protein KJO98_04755 [Rhodothermia bacterium]|nr:hypothetical protein [Rhodothermia bacterium]
MRTAAHILAALLVAAMVPALLFGAFTASIELVTLAFVIALGHAIVLGAPVVAILWRKGWINVLAAVPSGFAIGAAGIAIFTWPVQTPGTSASTGGIQTIVDGTPTLAGWTQYLYAVATFGALGAAGGVMFWLWLRMAGALPAAAADTPVLNVSKQGSVLFPLAIVVFAIGILSLPTVTKDRSCHNVLRDGRSHIRSQVNIDLDIEEEDWPALQEIFDSFSSVHELSFRDASEVRPDVVRTLYLSVCNEGVTISTAEQRWASQGYRAFMEGRGVGIGVYETQEDSAWRHVAQQLVSRLEQSWPDKVRYRDGGGRLVPPPTSLSEDQPE